MKKTIVGTFLVLAGMIIAFPLFSMSYYTMVRTSTPQFCASCHEIQFAYNTWKTSTHVNNGLVLVAEGGRRLQGHLFQTCQKYTG